MPTKAKIIETNLSSRWILSELNNAYFNIERSVDGQNWETIMKVNGAGNSSSTINYIEWDMNPILGLSYYRLSQTDFDGTTSKSEIRTVFFEGQDLFTIYPNPATSVLTLDASNLPSGEYFIEIFLKACSY